MIRGAQPFVERQAQALRRFFGRQADELQAARAFDKRKWDRVLTPVLLEHSLRTAQAFGTPVARRFGSTFDADEIADWLEKVALITASHVNQTTQTQIDEALREMSRSDALGKVFALAEVRASHIAISKTNTAANVGRQVAAEVGGAGSKMWIVTSNNPRSSHAGMGGETVQIGGTFSNGAKWPGDPNLSIDERANCACYCDFGE